MKPTLGLSWPSAVFAGPASTCLDDEDAEGQHANFGARLASSWTKQRLAVLCQAALASAAAIIHPYFKVFYCIEEEFLRKGWTSSRVKEGFDIKYKTSVIK
ncbi:hypothetical protein LOK49_LG10G02189 [Camellia lanceoleosa]|uniref:Uncharacterized protein n=1 Tax=Camellia lanceoleosa TaxID=1840588 RepID=A0ACC0GAW6_9ERIC|nr:hypothetical protein LOK49_LG10G02189 [Camellia lanceoleosa]